MACASVRECPLSARRDQRGAPPARVFGSVPRADVAGASTRTYAAAVRRPFVGVLVLACVAVIATSAGASEPSERSFQPPATVTEFAAGEYGRELAFASSCGAPHLWIVGMPRPTALDVVRPCSRRGAPYGLSHAGRVLSWGRWDVGGFSFWLALPSLETGSFPRRALRLAMVSARDQSGGALLVGEGRGNAVPYAVGRTVYLASQHTETGKPSREQITELSARPLWLSRTAGVIAVRRADGPVVILHESVPGMLRTYEYRPGVVRAAKLYGRRLVVLRDGRLDWHDYVPAQTRTLRLPPARSYGDGFCGRPPCTRAELRLEDLHRDLVVYVLRRQIHVLRLSDGKDVVVRSPGKGPVEAQIEGSGLSYSAGGAISFVPMRQVTKLLNER